MRASVPELPGQASKAIGLRSREPPTKAVVSTQPVRSGSSRTGL